MIGAVMRLLFVLAAFAPSPTPFIALMFAGFAIALAGHIVRSRATVAVGIALVFLGVLVLPLVLYGNPY